MKIKRAIVSSGPTREWIDPVRYISNASSGKMGYCLFIELKKWINEVIYIHGNILGSYIPKNAQTIYTETTQDMQNAVLTNIQNDTLVIMAAAPLDYKPVRPFESKIKKQPQTNLVLDLEPNPDILKSLDAYILKNSITNTVRVGFAAETNNLDDYALKKLQDKNLDYIIGNYVEKNIKGFGDLQSTLTIYSKDLSTLKIGPDSKENLAVQISKFLQNKVT